MPSAASPTPSCLFSQIRAQGEVLAESGTWLSQRQLQPRPPGRSARQSLQGGVPRPEQVRLPLAPEAPEGHPSPCSPVGYQGFGGHRVTRGPELPGRLPGWSAKPARLRMRACPRFSLQAPLPAHGSRERRLPGTNPVWECSGFCRDLLERGVGPGPFSCQPCPWGPSLSASRGQLPHLLGLQSPASSVLPGDPQPVACTSERLWAPAWGARVPTGQQEQGWWPVGF